MASYSADDAKKRYESLPMEIKNLLYSPGMSFTIQQIGQKNKLHLDQIDILNTETGQLMLGFVEPKDFNATLIDMLRIDTVQADAIVQDVNDMLLAPIREAMKKASEQTNRPGSQTPPANPPAQKSVVMPSSIAAAPAAAPAPIVPKPAPPSPKPFVPPAPVAPAPSPAADIMFTEPVVTMAPKAPTPPPAQPAPAAKVEPPKPSGASYVKTDPYREPPE